MAILFKIAKRVDLTEMPIIFLYNAILSSNKKEQLITGGHMKEYQKYSPGWCGLVD